MPKRSWTDEQLRAAVVESGSISQVLRCLGLKPSGGSHAIVKARILVLGLDTAHFHGQTWNQGNEAGLLIRHEPRPFEEILVIDSTYTSTTTLKRRLLKAGMLENRCDECGLPPEWRGSPLVMRLDHINGVRTDNRISNLRLLCPNCDSQMPTFAGRNKGWWRRLPPRSKGRSK